MDPKARAPSGGKSDEQGVRPPEAHGLLVIDKPEGLTSFDVVARVRKLLKTRRVGHTGTLDPMATGVLPVCVGNATRLVPYITEGEKCYRATVTLGAATDTLDRTGRVVGEAPWNEITRERVEEALARFRGVIEQIPPAYSAISVDGVRLYELARKGVEVERKARRVEIHELSLIGFEPPELTLEVRCSKGTYIRSLADDLGRALGTLAHLSALRRLASAGFTLENAVRLEELTSDTAPGKLLDPDLVLRSLPSLRHVALTSEQERRVSVGQRLSPAELALGEGLALGDRLLLLGAAEAAKPIAIAEWDGEVVRYLRVLVG